MAKIDPQAKEQLIQHWLPRLDKIRQRRLPMFILMVVILLLPLVFAVLLVVYMFIQEDLNAVLTIISGLLFGLSALVFVYLGKMQQCNDVLELIPALVYIGDKGPLLKALPLLSCLGDFREILQDLKEII